MASVRPMYRSRLYDGHWYSACGRVLILKDPQDLWRLSPLTDVWAGFLSAGCDIARLDQLRFDRLTDAANALQAIMDLAEAEIGPVEPIRVRRPRTSDVIANDRLAGRPGWIADYDDGHFVFIAPDTQTWNARWEAHRIAFHGSGWSSGPLNEPGYRTLVQARTAAATLLTSPRMTNNKYLAAWLDAQNQDAGEDA